MLPLLQSKIFVPPSSSTRVTRPRLLNRLNGGIDGKLTLISAPAGYGKTTLLGEWVAGTGRQVAWLSLDEADSDPRRFLAYLVTALQPIIQGGLPDVIHTASPPPTEAVLTALLNELNRAPRPIILILDDYHTIDAEAVDHILTFLVEHLPPHLHLVISTREDPRLSLARLRVRGHLTELRASDLRFTPSEVAEFLNQVMGLTLSTGDIAALEARTEGWVAALQLAALSMRGRQDIDGFIRTFTGDHRYIVDYLVEEVLQRQPEAIRNFLLQTAILSRLTGPLCDAVTEQKGGNARLELLERGNFFIVPLDNKRQWYRYHALFANVLYAHLMSEQPEHLSLLHERASMWYAQNGFVAEAVRHALAGQAFERAADLMEQAWHTMRRNREETLVLSWLKALPEAILRVRPILTVANAHVVLVGGGYEGVEERLREAEASLEMKARLGGQSLTSGAGMVVGEEEAIRRLPAEIAIARAGMALARGDVSGTMTYARQALDLAPEEDYLTRGGAAGFLGLALWTNGEIENAYTTYAAGMASLQKAGSLADVTNGAITLATLQMAQGQLRGAMQTYEQALQRATVQGTPIVRGVADLLMGMSEIHYERNELDNATQKLLESKGMGEHLGFPHNQYRWYVTMARILEAQGNVDGALKLLEEATHLYVSNFSPNVYPIPALMARMWLVQGKVEEANTWVREQGISMQDNLGYLREYEHITLARVLIAKFQRKRTTITLSDTLNFLAHLLNAAEAGKRNRSVIEILLLQAIAYQLQGDVPTAHLSLEKALTLAQPETYVRIFVDEGTPMKDLLESAVKKGIAPDYGRYLLNAWQGPPLPRPANQPLLEPLSDRELEVLRLLATDLSGPELARELMVSLSTFRTHTQHIYDKLGVTNRRAAVRRAEELTLL